MKITIERKDHPNAVFECPDEGDKAKVITEVLDWLKANEEDPFWEAISPYR